MIANLDSLDPKEEAKVKGWTVAQIVAWAALVERQGDDLEAHEALAATTVQARPGIGALYEPTVLGFSWRGVFYGIEPDGYVHT